MPKSKRPRLSAPLQPPAASKLPDDTIGRDPLMWGKEYIWEDEDPTDTGWLPLDWAGRKEGFKAQQNARFFTLYNPRFQNNYVDLTRTPPQSRLNERSAHVDLTSEREDVKRLQQLVARFAPDLRATLENLIARATACEVEVKQETTGQDYYVTIAADTAKGLQIRENWSSMMTITKQRYAKKHRMVYDTGAMRTSVSWKLAKRLGIVRKIPPQDDGEDEAIVFSGQHKRTGSQGIGGYAYGTLLENFSFWVLVSGTYAGNNWVKITTDLEVNDPPEPGSPQQFSLFGVDSIKQLAGKHRVVFRPG